MPAVPPTQPVEALTDEQLGVAIEAPSRIPPTEAPGADSPGDAKKPDDVSS